MNLTTKTAQLLEKLDKIISDKSSETTARTLALIQKETLMSNLNNNEANKMETEQMENVEKMLGGITPADHGNRPIAIRNGYGKIIKLIRW